MTNKRIPPKGTQAYTNYWRDRYAIEAAKNLETTIACMARVTEPHRQKCYDDALASVRATIDLLEEGWRK